MSDLDLVERFRADLPPADPAALSRARARMFHEPAARRRVRWVWGLAPAAALAAAVAVAVAAGGAPHPAPHPKQNAAPPPHSAAPGAPRIATDAAGVLRLAADEVRSEPTLPAEPGQFVYIESLDATDNVVNLETKPKWVPPRAKSRKIWLAVDGVKAGLLRETDVRTGKQDEDLPLDAHTVPAYVTNLPTDPKAMLVWLHEGDAGTYNDGSDAAAWGKIGDTLREQYLTPQEQAALFEAAAMFPGVTLVKQADLAGRPGVAVSRVDHQVRFDYIFDAKTYDFLGERVVVVGNLRPYPKGVVSRWTARLRVAIVDRAGQLP
jgi:hypothetical protein